jgi:type I site-specific restriction-modification system R (restriction) subunit
VEQAVTGIQKEHATTGGQLGKPASARRRVYERLKDYAANVKDTLFDVKPLHQAIDAIYEAPLTEAARDLLNREMKSGIDTEKLAELVLSLHEEDRLCVPQDDAEAMGDDKLKLIAAELITQVKKSVAIDWTLRESARAKIKVMVKRILNKHGYPPDLQEEAVKTVLAQAELLCAEWV